VHSIITDATGTTHDPSILQETSQIHVSCQDKTNVSGRSFSWSSQGATDVRNALKELCNRPTAGIPSQNE